jgi:hypothetical protein
MLATVRGVSSSSDFSSESLAMCRNNEVSLSVLPLRVVACMCAYIRH